MKNMSNQYMDRLKTAVTALGWFWNEIDPGRIQMQKVFDRVGYYIIAYNKSFVEDIRAEAETFDENKWVIEWIRDQIDGAMNVPPVRELLGYANAIQSELWKLQYAVAAVPEKDDCKLVHGNVPFVMELTEQELSGLLQCSEEYTKELLMKKLQAGELKFDGEVLVMSNHHPEPGQWRIREDIEVTIHF